MIGPFLKVCYVYVLRFGCYDYCDYWYMYITGILLLTVYLLTNIQFPHGNHAVVGDRTFHVSPRLLRYVEVITQVSVFVG